MRTKDKFSNLNSDFYEVVLSCPYCGSISSKVSVVNANDWTFNALIGTWSYDHCLDCKSLYQNPRIKREYIGQAYAKYYTHSKIDCNSLFARAKLILKNEWFSIVSKVDFQPRVTVLRNVIDIILLSIKGDILPFGIDFLAKNNSGYFLDYGCGSGYYLKIAGELGWFAKGIDFDGDAVKSGLSNGMDIDLGDDLTLESYDTYYDCILCSHVIEHVHNPKILLMLLFKALKSGGVLLISAPNSNGDMFRIFKSCWRGLEAPRHISIPSEIALVNLCRSIGFKVKTVHGSPYDTLIESLKISKKAFGFRLAFEHIMCIIYHIFVKRIKKSDTIRLICEKP